MSSPTKAPMSTPWGIFLIFLRLGLTSFGGPIAHLGYFHNEFVTQRRWLSEDSYADLIALCQFLPGPASSQVGVALGLIRAGYAGALAAWAGFTLPSAIILILLAQGISLYGTDIPPGILEGLKIAAVAIVAQAVWSMARKFCPDTSRIIIMAAACCLSLLITSPWAQVGIISLSGIAGLLLRPHSASQKTSALTITITRRAGTGFLLLFFALLISLPILAGALPNQSLILLDVFYRAGSLVFGGGHVILPLLQAEVVPNGWVSNETFLAGYGAAQAIPGPLFTFAAFLGAAMNTPPSGLTGATLCLLAIFLPSGLLIAGALPFWETLRHQQQAQSALAGINAAVVGLLLSAMYQPLWTSAIHGVTEFCIMLAALSGLLLWKIPSWLVVAGCIAGSYLVATLT